MSQQEFSESSIVQKRDELVEANIEESVVLLSINDGKYYGFNAIASAIWEMLDAPHRFSEICQSLESKFEVSPEVCKKETSDFLRTLCEKGLISVS